MSVPSDHHANELGEDSAGATIEFLSRRIAELEKSNYGLLDEKASALASAMEECEDAISIQTPAATVAFWSRGAQRIYGYSAQEMVGRPASVLIPAERLDEATDIVRRLQAGERIESFKTERLRKDGTRVRVWFGARPVLGNEGRVVGAVHVTREAANPSSYDEAVSEIAAIARCSDDAVIRVGLDGVVRSWNAGAQRLFGYASDEVLGRSLMLLLPSDREAEETQILRTVREGQDVRLHTKRVQKDGALIDVTLAVSPVRNSTGEICGAVQIARNVSEYMRLESATGHLAAVVESSEDAIISKNLDGIILTWNHAAERVYGYTEEEVRWRPMTILLPSDRPNEESDILDRMRRGERVDHFETERVRKDGTRIHVSLTISPIRDKSGNIIGASHVARDISERKALEAGLLQTQKLESLGVLAGGIAHDFNNLLTGILGNTSLALESVSTANPNRRLMHDIMRAAERAADLTRQLLAYAGKGRFMTEAVNLSDLVHEISKLIYTSVPRNVQLRLELADDLPPIEADAGQLQQVVMNLVINAAESIGDQLGSVVVSTGVQQVDDAYLRSAWGGDDVSPGLHVALQVQDNGCGMDEDTLSRIFDPFFTTKFTGRGLGLAAVLGIVRGHDGALKVYSTPGQGTTFRVLFRAAARRTRRQPTLSSEQTDLSGTETILIVDDEEVVRETARNALERYGYTVLLAENGRAAVRVFEQSANQIALVLLDLTMPVMGGEEALREIKSIRPDVPVLLSSGFNEVEAVRRFTGKGLAGFIQKPYAAARLVERIRAVLGAHRQSQASRLSGSA